MKALKSARTLAASLGVLAIGAMAASPAMAFDDVDWNWWKTVNETVDIRVRINIDVYPTGLVEVEKLQIFLGDVHAYNHVSHIYNNPIYPEADKRYVNGYEVKDSYYAYDPYGGSGNNTQNITINQVNTCSALYGSVACANSASAVQTIVDTDLGYTGDWYEVAIKPLDARYELPIILASATAVGNNQSITADVPIFLHDGQFVANTREGRECDKWCDALYALPTADLATTTTPTNGTYDHNGNLHHQVALAFGVLSLVGLLEHSEISAQSQVDYVTNVSVDNSATAVANNISVNLASDNPQNHVVIADITQFALANVSAQTYTHNVSAYGYSHMRELTTPTLVPTDSNPNQVVNVPTPWISSTATAVGNNVSINVGPVLAE